MKRYRRAESGMTLVEHLQELRYRFFVMFVTVMVFAILGWIFYPELLKVIQDPYCSAVPGRCKFLVVNPLDGLTFRVKLGLFGGFLAASPVILWQCWRFITPGLKKKEKRYVIPFVFASLLFFAMGATLAYLSFAHAIRWLRAIGGSALVTYYDPSQYLSLFLLMLVVFGLSFLFPVVLVALELARVVTPRQLLGGWRYAIITITVVAAVITPSSDPLSMVALAAPLCAFYFLAIGVGKLLKR